MNDPTDRAAICELIENGVVWHDGGKWERFATLWHPLGWMATRGFRQARQIFTVRSHMAWEKGLTVCHVIGGTAVAIIAERRCVSRLSSAHVHGVEVDVPCLGRWRDALERVEGRWLLRLRQPIYELDQTRRVNPSAPVSPDPGLLATFPGPPSPFAFLQTGMGLDVARDLPGSQGAAMDAQRETARRCW